jgi:membrane protein required for colicin V production
MNYIDLFLVILLLIAAVQGFRKGFIIEFASLAALILGIWGGIKFADLTAGLITRYTGFHSDYLSIIAFLLVFIFIVILIHMMGKMLDKIIKIALLGFLNRLAGIVFGVLKLALILSILLLLFDEVDENVHLLPVKQKQESSLYEPMKQVVPTLLPFIKLKKIYDKDKEESNSPQQPKIKIT